MRGLRGAAAIVFISLLGNLVEATLRLGCSQLVTERFDPLVTPGEVSPHLHQIVGGNGFDLTIPAGADLAKLATCTTCRYKEDKSNYWTAVMFFKHPNGSFIRVPQMANHNTGPGLMHGGMTIYYFQPVPPTKDLNVTAFAPGFRMIVGNPTRRQDDIDPSKTAHKALNFRCFEGASSGPGVPPGSSPGDYIGLPPVPCSGGIRSNIYFPQCWNGRDLDPPDHQSHVAHPSGTPDPDLGLQFFGTECPDSHPVRIPLLFIEIVWDTRPFNDPALWPKDGTQPFVFSQGDPTGYGQHADYVFGWEGDSLQRAMDKCHDFHPDPSRCKELTLQDMDTMNSCRLPVKVPEVTEEQYLKKLPGCNPVEHGPGPAKPVPNCDAVSTTVNAPMPTDAPRLIVPPWPLMWNETIPT